MVEKLHERVIKGLLDQYEEMMGYNWELINGLCESPIEVAFALALVGITRLRKHGPAWELARQAAEEKFADLLPLLIPQYEWQGKRIDFKYRFKHVAIFIECDGHDFHERTAYQATRDRRKDRLIQSVGIPILRFTGAEIYHDPFACAEEVVAFADTKCAEIWQAQEA